MKKQGHTIFGSVITITEDFKTNDDWRFERPVRDGYQTIRCFADLDSYK
jgi:hypothetical protein